MTLHTLFNIDPYQWSSIGTAILCGTIVGLERQLRGKPVGIRTSALITLGTYLFLATSFLLKGNINDPSRVVGQIITGIGFLGAGVMMTKDGAVMGVTSAATIWVLAAIGIMIATDHHEAAIKVSILVVIILYGASLLEEHTKAFSRGVHATVKKYSRSGK